MGYQHYTCAYDHAYLNHVRAQVCVGNPNYYFKTMFIQTSLFLTRDQHLPLCLFRVRRARAWGAWARPHKWYSLCACELFHYIMVRPSPTVAPHIQCVIYSDTSLEATWKKVLRSTPRAWNMAAWSRMTIKVSLSLNQLKTRGIGDFKEGKRERDHRTSAILCVEAKTSLERPGS